MVVVVRAESGRGAGEEGCDRAFNVETLSHRQRGGGVAAEGLNIGTALFLVKVEEEDLNSLSCARSGVKAFL